MNLFKISWSHIKSKPLDTSLSLVLLAFGVGIISMLLLVEVQLRSQFDRNIKDIDLVLGAKGSPLQMILSAVYQIDAPTGNISKAEADRIIKHPFIKEGIPLAYGDSYEKYRIVGSTPAYPEHYGVKIAEGRLWEKSFDAVLGATVAQQKGLKIGDEFYSSHGLDDGGEAHGDHAFHVVGILEKGNCVLDQLVLTGMESIWEVHQHEGEEIAEEDKQYTAVLLKKNNPMAIMALPKLIQDSNMQLALPAIEINRLNQNFGIGMDTIRAIAIVIMLLSFVSVFISLYNSLKERKYELALMRSMGGTRSTLFRLILQEGLLLTLIGFALGVILSRVGLYLLSEMLQEEFNYSLNSLAMLPSEFILLGVSIFVGILASFLPAIKAVRMDISQTLADA